MKHPYPNEVDPTEEIAEFDDSRDGGLLGGAIRCCRGIVGTDLPTLRT